MSVSGAYLAVQINGTTYADPMDWTAEGEAEALDRTSGSTGGFHKADPGIKRCQVTINFVQDTTNGVVDTSIAEGTVLVDLKLYRNSNDNNPAFYFPSALILRSGVAVKVKGGGVMVPLTVESRGTYTRYGPSTP